jgi:CDP-glucose 4,6-dehydratase
MGMNLDFYKGKKVLITGHTGFKGTWLSKLLINAGASVAGFALNPPTYPNLFDISHVASQMDSYIGDIRNLSVLKEVFDWVQPEIVFHLAAQPIVRESYKNPVYTYETNVMGTVNMLECVRLTPSVKSLVIITTDKVYHNQEWDWGYRENDELNGFDPYSNSKSCSELVSNAYRNSFFSDRDLSVSTARAGNVIGGGDFAQDRIIPDCVRAAMKNEPIIIRNPYSTRPYQHVLEPLCVYAMIAQYQYENKDFAGAYNVGPNDIDCITTGKLVGLFCEYWGNELTWENKFDGGPHEAKFLKLDCSKLKTTFDWKPKWNIQTSVERTIEWTKIYLSGGNISKLMDGQISEYLK